MLLSDKTWAGILAVLIGVSLTACSIPPEPWTQEPKEIAGYNTTANTVNSVTFSSDGRTLITGCKNNKILLWNAKTGELLRTLKTMNPETLPTPNTLDISPGRRVFLSPDGTTGVNILYLMDRNTNLIMKKLITWNVQTGELLQTLTGHEGWIWGVAFSPDGKFLASGGTDRAIILWDVHTNDPLAMLEQMDPVRSLAFSPDGKVLAAGSFRDLTTEKSSGTIYLWDIQTKEILHTLEGHKRAIECLAFSPDGEILASGSWDGTMRLWDVRTGTQLKVMTEIGGPVVSAAFSPDGKIVAGGSSWDGNVRLWDVETGVMLRKMRVSERWSRWQVSSVAFSPDGETLAASTTGGIVRLWNVKTGEELQVLTSPSPMNE